MSLLVWLSHLWPYRHYRAWVSPTVMRGSRPNDRETLELRGLGIKSILSLEAENNDDAERQERLGLSIRVQRYKVVDFTPPGQEIIAFALDWISDPQNQPCYVHCRAGRGRTGVLIACYRFTKGMPLEQALAEARSFGLTDEHQINAVREFAFRFVEYPRWP